MTPAEVLRKARDRIATPQRWCSYWSVSNDGKRICALMAIYWAASGTLEPSEAAREPVRLLAAASGSNSMWADSAMWADTDRVVWLNGGKHKDVMAAFARAIVQAEAGQ